MLPIYNDLQIVARVVCPKFLVFPLYSAPNIRSPWGNLPQESLSARMTAPAMLESRRVWHVIAARSLPS